MRKVSSIFLAVLVMVVSACGDGDATAISPSPVPGVPYLDQAIEAIPAKIETYMKAAHVPGAAIAVVQGGKVVYAQGFGIANMDTGAKVDADTVFQLASISKAISSTVISTQVTAGKVGWNTKIHDALPWFALGTGTDVAWVSGEVTLGDMYSHRAGLPDHCGDDLEGLGYDRQTILTRLRYLPLNPFRASYAYTNYGIMTAAQAVSQRVGKDWVLLTRDALYAPLGMARTTSSYQEFLTLPNRASGHSPIDDKLDGTWRVTPVPFNTDRQTAAGGSDSSANDMAKWMIMLLADGKTPGGQQLIASAVLNDSMSVHNVLPLSGDAGPTAINGFYGYGFSTGQASNGLKYAAHNGALGQGFSANFQVVPALDLGIVVLTNGFPVGLPETVVREFIDLAQFGVVKADYWEANSKMFREAIKAAFGSSSVSGNPPAGARPAQPLARYAGTYRNDYLGEAQVTVSGNALQLHMGPADGGKNWSLTHWDGDTFKLLLGTDDASATAVSAVRFDLSGPKATLWLEHYDGTSNGRGTLSRDDRTRGGIGARTPARGACGRPAGICARGVD
jgi:CubicO group peptidase (beta-lactamase class C family)